MGVNVVAVYAGQKVTHAFDPFETCMQVLLVVVV